MPVGAAQGCGLVESLSTLEDAARDHAPAGPAPQTADLHPPNTGCSPRLARPLFVSLFMHFFDPSKGGQNLGAAGGLLTRTRVKRLVRIRAVSGRFSRSLGKTCFRAPKG
jgi:hypothetical protein